MSSINMSNLDKPAPAMYRRFVNATIMFFIPMLTGIVQGLTMSDKARNICMVGIVAIPFLLKGIQMVLGNGQVYADISQIKKSELAEPSEVKEINKEDKDK